MPFFIIIECVKQMEMTDSNKKNVLFEYDGSVKEDFAKNHKDDYLLV